MTDKIEAQTKALSAQLEKLNNAKTDEEYLIELEKYHAMLKKADFRIEVQSASKKRILTRKDKILAPIINRVTGQVNKVNKKLKQGGQ